MTPHGWQSSSLEEVGSVFVNYFQQQLGTSNPTIPLDNVVIQSGPCLLASSHAFLLSPVTHEDIRKVVFNIEDDKAPSLDGYSSLFFKHAWHIVGADFYAVVQDFFIIGQLLCQVN